MGDSPRETKAITRISLRTCPSQLFLGGVLVTVAEIRLEYFRYNSNFFIQRHILILLKVL